MRTTLAFLVLAAMAFAGSTLSSRAQSQNEMTQQAWADFDKADKELNVVYQKILKTLDDDITRQKFIAAQKAWLKYRDTQGAFDSDEMRGGSGEPMLLAASETETTKARIEQLKKYLAEQTTK
jgi:uncharacterized protein YecT (DUF1311 family)